MRTCPVGVQIANVSGPVAREPALGRRNRFAKNLFGHRRRNSVGFDESFGIEIRGENGVAAA